MKKIIFLSFVFLNTFGSWTESLKSDWQNWIDSFQYDKSFEQCLADHKEAFENLEKNKSGVVTRQWTEYAGNTIIYHYDYQCSNSRVESVVNNYLAAYKALNSKMFGRALGDGFIIGGLLALYNKIANGTMVKSKTVGAITLAPLALIIQQNFSKPQTPYFDIALEKKDNAFANLSFDTVGRIVCAIGASWASFMGSSFMINKVTQ